jgi:error-prone DNA polymerase
MTAHEETMHEFRGTGITTGPHPVSFVRPQLARAGVTPASELSLLDDGVRARIAGMVIVRQRPGTASGIVFITLEDETGFSNAVVFSDRYQRWRRVILGHPALVIEGVVQKRDGVITLMAESFEPLRGPTLGVGVSHDFH